jgi:hypothetical protein
MIGRSNMKGYDPIPLFAKKLLLRAGWDMWGAVLTTGSRSTVLRDRMRHPLPGDWVFETSTAPTLLWGHGNNESWDGQIVRYLYTLFRLKPLNPNATDTETDETLDWIWTNPLRCTEEVYICENPDGTTFTWSNASLAALPGTWDHWPK